MSYLLDTNIVCELAKKAPNKSVTKWIKQVPEDNLYLSVITVGEIRKGVEKLSNSAKKNRLRIWLESDLPDWFQDRLLDINTDVSDRWGILLSNCKRTLPAIDSLTAATALHYDLTLVTRNEKDYKDTGVTLINPF